MSQYLWSVATGNVNPFMKRSREVVKYISGLEGFKAVHPNSKGTLWLFDSENHAKAARNLLRMKGVQCGNNICRFRWDGAKELVFDDPEFERGGVNENRTQL